MFDRGNVQCPTLLRDSQTSGAFFKGGESDLLNQVACLCVLYEDLRVELNGLKTGQERLGDLDTLGWQYRFFYFLRRSLVTLSEFRWSLDTYRHEPGV